MVLFSLSNIVSHQLSRTIVAIGLDSAIGWKEWLKEWEWFALRSYIISEPGTNQTVGHIKYTGSSSPITGCPDINNIQKLLVTGTVLGNGLIIRTKALNEITAFYQQSTFLTLVRSPLTFSSKRSRHFNRFIIICHRRKHYSIATTGEWLDMESINLHNWSNRLVTNVTWDNDNILTLSS